MLRRAFAAVELNPWVVVCKTPALRAALLAKVNFSRASESSGSTASSRPPKNGPRKYHNVTSSRCQMTKKHHLKREKLSVHFSKG
ncbi:hypothetical protein BV898_05075 [Hypsibius exemplaris]|uniref:Uncharacterized protein n=1 Tax=Hypsibius exemplaris TaxID=2072580 RepID=A0A1W0X0L9_HYPEX|nr:hypothetical protein BV898_05075 [Hypsibius exemplaris]